MKFIARSSWTATAAAALALATSVCTIAPTPTHALQLQTSDASYVVQIHSSRDDTPFNVDPATTRTQLMTIESGQQFECFVPLTPEKLAVVQESARDAHAHKKGDEDETEQEREAAFLAFGRAAAKKIRPKCVQYVDIAENWVYEVCPGVLVRKVSLRARSLGEDAREGGSGESMQEKDTKADGDKSKQPLSHEVVELGEFVSDAQAKALEYSDFVGADTQERVRKHQKPLFTQNFRVGGASSGSSKDGEEQQQLQVQFICSATTLDDTVAGVRWKKAEDGKDTRSVAAFLVLSRLFCDPKHADADEYKLFTVPSLLRPVVDAKTCIKRNEGWWTYEFCFGQGIRQYHRDGEGRITAEFSLGSYDVAKNTELERSGGALVTEHIDATHDVSRPAYLELYGQGTHCKEFDHFTPRRAKVYYYCNQGGSNHYILGVKETQTCVYSVKISSPVLCDHPHFLSAEQKSEERAEIVHCVPLATASSQEASHHHDGTTTITTAASATTGASAPAGSS